MTDLGRQDPYDHADPSLIYSCENVPGLGCDRHEFDVEFEGCDCDPMNRCDSQSCRCLMNKGPNYHSKPRTFIHLATSKPVYECHDKCKCNPESCGNRCVQFGPITGLVIRESGAKGLGVYTEVVIKSNTFVCEYAGEIVGDKVARLRIQNQEQNQKMNYIIFVNENYSINNPVVRTIVDPTKIGNLGRYLNHSCTPNLAMHPIRVSNNVPHLSLFAKRDINAGEELTFDYSDGFKNPEDELGCSLKTCYCQSKNCRKMLPFNPLQSLQS